MAVSKDKLASIIAGKAKQLCSPEGDRMISRKINENNNGGGFDDPDPSMYDVDAYQFDSMFSSSVNESSYAPTYTEPSYNMEKVNSSKMPDFIKHSMVNEQIDLSPLQNVSVLDTLNIKPTPKPKQNKQMVREQIAPQQPIQQQYISQPSVDYSIIKAIVNECLNEYFSKQQINESNSLKNIILKEGTITLVDNKDNLYKAKLQKIDKK